MADADGGVDGVGLHAGSVPATGRSSHRWIHLTGTRRAESLAWRPAAQTLVGREREREAVAATLAALRSAAPAGCCSSRGSRASESRGCSRTSPSRRRRAPRRPPARRRTTSGARRSPPARRATTSGAPRSPPARRGTTGRAPCSPPARRSTRPTCRTRCGPTRWTAICPGPGSGGSRGSAWPARMRSPRSRRRWPAARRAARTATASIARCATCSSGSRAPRRSCCASTTCTGRTLARSRRSPRCVHRPPAAPVLLALAARAGRLPAALTSALAAGRPCGSLRRRWTRRRRASWSATRRTRCYADSGGNPFYLEQLARGGAPRTRAPGRGRTTRCLPRSAPRWRRSWPRCPPPRGGCSTPPRSPAIRSRPGSPPRSPSSSESAALAALDVLLATGAGPAGRGAAPVRVPPPGRAARGVRGGAGRLADRRPRASGGGARAARRRTGAAQPPRRAGRAAGRRGGDRRARRGRAASSSRSPRRRRPATRRDVCGCCPAAAIRRRSSCGSPTPRRRRATRRGARHAARRARHGAEPADRLRVTVGVANAEWWIGPHRGRPAAAARRARRAARATVAGPRPAAARARPHGADEPRARPSRAGQAADARDDARAIGDPVFEAAALACSRSRSRRGRGRGRRWRRGRRGRGRRRRGVEAAGRAGSG